MSALAAHHRLTSEAETADLGRAIAGRLRGGDAVLLSGGLGAGKSTLARALIRALTHPDEDVPSPTFTLVQTYEGALPVAHFDLYRLANADEARELGLDEALDAGVAVIEWPERLGQSGMAALSPHRLHVRLAVDGEGRQARLDGHGRWKDEVA